MAAAAAAPNLCDCIFTFAARSTASAAAPAATAAKAEATVAATLRGMLRAGADPNALNKNGSSPAIGAAFFGRPECLRILLEAGADPTIADEEGTTTFTALDVPWPITKMIADALQMPLDQELLVSGRDACRAILSERR